jgi:type III secretion system FlhB-like substrate exporter
LSDPSSDTPSDVVADAIVARIRELSQAHGATVLDDATLAELMASLRITDQVPVAAFSVAADLLFHLLAADQRPLAEATP